MDSELLLMPGLDGTGELFAPLQASLGSTQRLTIIRYQDEVGFDDYVRSAHSLLPAQSAILIAESFSGPVALALAAKYPDRIRGLVLCATFVLSPHRMLSRLARLVPTPFLSFSLAQSMLLKKYCLEEGCSASLFDHAFRTLRSVPRERIRQRLTVLGKVDVRLTAASIVAPVLILKAKQDRLVSGRRYEQLIAALPHATVQVVDGPHMLLQTRPHECSAAIRAFIESC
jgi:pimeloyl-[acyl-carrier protein] methyl ester esterase